MATILVDSSFVIALFSPPDKNHAMAREFVRDSRDVGIIPDVALTEIAYLLRRDGGIPAVQTFLAVYVTLDMPIECIEQADLTRAREIMLAYADAHLDFVDCCVMALAERMNVTQICTFDRRDFALFRPKHCEYLELLP